MPLPPHIAAQLSNRMTVYICMETCVFNYAKALQPFRTNDSWLNTKERESLLYDHPTILETIEPMEGSIESIQKLIADKELYDVHLVMENSWTVPNVFENKKAFIKKHLRYWDMRGADKLIFGYQKQLMHGHFLVEDFRCGNQAAFKGWYIPMFTTEVPNWNDVEYLLLNQHPFLLRYFQRPMRLEDYKKKIRLIDPNIIY